MDTISKVRIAYSANGQYTITWSAPIDNSLIRYYNIYAVDSAVPQAIQQDRIASVPAASDYAGNASFRYVDLLGNPDGMTKYLVTAVDYQGNESSNINLKESPIINVKIREEVP